MIIYTLESVLHRREMVYTKGFMSGISCRDRSLGDWGSHCAWPGFENWVQVYSRKERMRTLQKTKIMKKWRRRIAIGTGAKWGRFWSLWLRTRDDTLGNVVWFQVSAWPRNFEFVLPRASKGFWTGNEGIKVVEARQTPHVKSRGMHREDLN